MYLFSSDFRIDRSGKPTHFAQDQLRQITGYHKLEIELPEPVYKPSTWELKVANAGVVRGAEVVYPHILSPCSADSTSATNPK
jgi:hypothetical protein